MGQGGINLLIAIFHNGSTSIWRHFPPPAAWYGVVVRTEIQVYFSTTNTRRGGLSACLASCWVAVVGPKNSGHPSSGLIPWFCARFGILRYSPVVNGKSLSRTNAPPRKFLYPVPAPRKKINPIPAQVSPAQILVHIYIPFPYRLVPNAINTVS